MQYYGPKRFLDSFKKFHTGLTIFNNKKQDLGKPSQLASTVAVRFGFSRIFPKFDQFPRSVSPSSRGVRSSDYVRCKALDVISQKNKNVSKHIFPKKVAAR